MRKRKTMEKLIMTNSTGTTATTHPKNSMLYNSKYTIPWAKLKETKEIIITVLDRSDKAKVIRGLSQLKNIDTEWKKDNYYLRIKAEVIRETNEGQIVLKITLVDSVKYRNGIF